MPRHAPTVPLPCLAMPYHASPCPTVPLPCLAMPYHASPCPTVPRNGLGWARQGLAGLGKARQGVAGLGKAWLGSARLGKAWLGSARLGKAWLGSAKLGWARQPGHGAANPNSGASLARLPTSINLKYYVPPRPTATARGPRAARSPNLKPDPFFFHALQHKRTARPQAYCTFCTASLAADSASARLGKAWLPHHAQTCRATPHALPCLAMPCHASPCPTMPKKGSAGLGEARLG